MKKLHNGRNIAKVMISINSGTKFQKIVWNEISKIKKGEILTYKDIAIKIGRPRSSRAVANACGKNPLIKTICCYRVIRSDGFLGGYSGDGGIKRKIELLANEGHKFTKSLKLIL